MTMPHKIQATSGAVVLLLLLVFLFLNRQTTEVVFIFGTFVVSRALLVLTFFGAGMLVGWVAHSILMRKKRVEKEHSS